MDSALLDSQLLMSALARVLESPNNKNTAIATEDDPKILLLAASADLCTAACEYMKTRPTPDTCFLAEYELVASHGKAFLAGIEQHVHSLLSLLLRLQQNPVDNDDKDKDVNSCSLFAMSTDTPTEIPYAIMACLRTASSLISLFGHKLSRVNLQGLYQVAWSCLGVVDSQVVTAASVLLATLPMAGGTTDQRTPAALWNQAVADIVDALMGTLRTVAPIAHRGEQSSLLPDNSVWKMVLELWIPSMEQAPTQDSRVQHFLQLVDGIAHVLEALWTRPTVGVGAATAQGVQSQFLGCQANVGTILSLIDCLLNFSTAAESKYYATKKRLRREAISDGLLSPEAMASVVANPLRWLGHKLLDSMLTALGASALTPYARRISKTVQSALLTSSSWTLRAALDPTMGLQQQQQGKKRPRWLHTSLAMRTCAIHSFHLMVLLFGTDPQPILMSSSSTAERPWNTRGHGLDRAISVVCGVVVEELTADRQQGSEDWGTFEERVQLMAEALDALVVSLNSGGEYWSMETRGLINSVTSACLSFAQQRHTLTLQPSVRAAILLLGAANVITPWQDGASCDTTLVDNLQRVARSVSSPSPSVKLAAATVLGLCKTRSCSRVPALRIVTRSGSSHDDSGGAHTSNTVGCSNDSGKDKSFIGFLSFYRA